MLRVARFSGASPAALARSSQKAHRRIAAAFLLAVGCAVVASQIHGQAQSASSNVLKFFTNYFITGDYVVAGVGLRGQGGQNGAPAGFAVGKITIADVPADADVVAAFLYWQVVSKDSTTLGPDSGAMGAKFDGQALSSADGPFAKVLERAGTAPCWSSGGGTGGGSSGGTIRTYTYRADVRRFLRTDANDRIVANGDHTVQVPDSGPTGNGVPIALGASLVIVYRHPDKPFKAIVLYDGGLTIDNSNQTYQLTLKGFYQPASAQGEITYIVGSGQPNKYEDLYFNNQKLATNPFDADPNGPSWDTERYPVSLASSPPVDPQYGAVVTTKFDTALSGGDCLTPAMVGFSTEVQDTDHDGLLDMWEGNPARPADPNNAGKVLPILDPNGKALPDLVAMGASATRPDLFVEFGYMKTTSATTYGTLSKPAHTHLPTAAALKIVGDAYANGPNGGVRVHFDVGDNYQGGEAGPYVIATSLARGGEAIDESVTTCAWPDCQFPLYPGTVGWKAGYKYFRDQLLNSNPPALDKYGDDPCDVESVSPGNDDGPGGKCERRFDRNRKNIFRYVLGAHFAGLPKSEYPCLAADGSTQVPASADGTCTGAGQPNFLPPASDNPLFHEPRTVSGIGDFPGADLMLTLGGFSDAVGRPVGTPIQQAGTLMHELGHTFDLGHAGIYVYSTTPTEEPNCNPNYLSVMNYLFQLRGLFDQTAAPRADYSWAGSSVFSPIDEASPGTIQAWPGRYFTGWYAPQSTAPFGAPVSRHCTGTQIVAGEPPMARVDGPSSWGAALDWDLDALTTTQPQDINFDGKTGALGAGHDDWNTLRLNQLATRRNVYGMSLNIGRDGMGRGDILGRDGMGRDGMGRDGMGRDGMGRDGMGRDGMGRDGMGRDGMGRDGMGRDGMGGGDGLGRDGLGHDWMNRDVGELDAEVAAAAGHVDVAPPTVTFSTNPSLTAGGYSQSAVTLTVTATDASRVSALSCLPALDSVTSLGQQSATGQVTVSAQGQTNIACTATDGAGNTANATFTVRIDSAAPATTITTPADGATYYLNQAVAVNYTCSDATSGVASCTGAVTSDGTNWTPVANGASLDTSSLGSRTFRVTAVDNAGNTVTKTASYSIGYNVTLTPLKSPAQLGSAVPVVWQVKDGAGNVISDTQVVWKLESVFTGLSCGSQPPVLETLYSAPDGSTGKSTLRFVAPNFQFNWDTTSASTSPTITGKGCYTVRIYLTDAPTKAYTTTAVVLK